MNSKSLRRVPVWCFAVGMLVACDAAVIPAVAPPAEPGMIEATRDGPVNAPPGSCWGKTVSPAVIETTSVQVQTKPAQVNPDGSIGKLPVFRTEQRQSIVTPRQDNWFETPCAEVLTAEFLSSLQRALSVRGFYRGPITGEMTKRTRAAVGDFHESIEGPESEVLSLKAARALGLIKVDKET